MPVNLSIKNAPDEIVVKLKARAARNHRSLQGELMAIVTAAAEDQPAATLGEISERVRRLDFDSPDEAVEIVRQMRDARDHDILDASRRR
jgi:antitoxin FitA